MRRRTVPAAVLGACAVALASSIAAPATAADGWPDGARRGRLVLVPAGRDP